MACNDPKLAAFENLPDGCTYELSLTGSPGDFAAFAQFDEAEVVGFETWPSAMITPAPKKRLLGFPGQTHMVFVFVDIVTPANSIVRVLAKIVNNGQPVGDAYCRDVTGPNGTREIITHVLRMA